MESYSSTRIGIIARIREALDLYFAQSRAIPRQVGTLISRVKEIEERSIRHGGPALKGLDVLEVGPGQRCRYLKYFALRNHAIGIDLDAISDELTARNILKMLKVNGLTRAGKTIIRKSLGLDRRFDREVCRQLGIKRLPPASVLQMNAEEMTLGEASLDWVFSCSTFEHLPRPELVIRQINRIMRSGGAAQVMLHLYTSEGGAHDSRIIANRRAEVPLWAHLRPQHQGLVRSNSYLNRIRLKDWEEMFLREAPGVTFEYIEADDSGLRGELGEIRRSGELEAYTDKELLTVELVALWRKP